MRRSVVDFGYLTVSRRRLHDFALFFVALAGVWSFVLIFLLDRTLWRALLGLVVAFAVLYVGAFVVASWIGAWVWREGPKIEAELAASAGLAVEEWRRLPREERDRIVEDEIEKRFGSARR